MYQEGKLNSIRNPEGFWINSQVFREEALHFTKYGYYCPDAENTPSWFNYWREQRRRCNEGYSVGGVKITGDHYFYLNFCPIQKVEDSSGSRSRKIKGFPDFWDGDYNYFWVREIARYGILDPLTEDESKKSKILDLPSEAQALELKSLFESLNLEVKIKPDYLKGGYNLIVGKSRRKGYSYKAAAIASNAYFTKPNALIIFGAYEKKYLYPGGLFTMSVNNINFNNIHTGWRMPADLVNKQDHIKSSWIEKTADGNRVEKGFMSQIMALTFQNNPDAARGKDAEEIFFEESGAFGTPGLLKQSLVATNDCVMAGSIKTGMITVFGTSGDMDGGTADYSEMFNNPLAFGFLPFKNVWDENAEESSVGFFHPINWNMEGYYDEQGNSDTKKAKEFEEKDRKELLDAGATSIQISQRMQEKPLTPTEAFNLVSTNNYPVLELNRRLHKVKSQHLQEKLGRLVDFYMDDSGTVKTSTILDGSKTAITSLQDIPKDPRGCPIIYEDPVPNAPKGLYKIGYDPVRQDSGTSLAAIIVYKGVYRGDYRHSVIVAEYVGRYETTDDIDRLASFFAMYYNTQIMYENEVTSVKRYFQQRKILHLLAEQPDNVISKNIKKSRVSRTFGCHMTGPLKDAGERYIKDWLLTELDTIIDEDGNKQVITVIDTINSRRLLEELIKYNREGNFDLHSALIMCIFQVQEETFEKEYGEEKSNKRIEQLLNSMHRRFK